METKDFEILYGSKSTFVNVTLTALLNCVDEHLVLRLPPCDVQRARLLGDPFYGVCKTIVIQQDSLHKREYSHKETVELKLDSSWNVCRALQHWRSLTLPQDVKPDPVLELLCLMHTRSSDRVLLLQPDAEDILSYAITSVLENRDQLQVFVRNANTCKSKLDEQKVKETKFDLVVTKAMDGHFNGWISLFPNVADSINTLIVVYASQKDVDVYRGLLLTMSFRSDYAHSRNESHIYYEVWTKNEPAVTLHLASKMDKPLYSGLPVNDTIVAKKCPWCKRYVMKDDNCDYIFACGLDEHGVFHVGKGCGRAFCWKCADVEGKGRVCGQQIDPLTGQKLLGYREHHDTECCTKEEGFVQSEYCSGGDNQHVVKRW